MKIEKKFSAKSKCAYDNFEFITTSSALHSPSGDVIFSKDNIVAPAHWSQVAIDILAQKYFRKNGIPAFLKKIEEEGVPAWLQQSEPDYEKLEELSKEDRFIGESDSRQVFTRIAGGWTYWGWKEGYFSSEKDAKNYFEEMRYILASQMAAPNSPQWFNTGLNWAYGITSEISQHYYFDETAGKVVESHDAYIRPQPHACFIQSVEDNIGEEDGIMSLWSKEARLFKYGSGTGTNFSKLRGKNEPLSGGGVSSGLMSFLKIGDVAAGSIKSGGTTRRAAKMVVLDADHPDIEDFVSWKIKEEQKVVSLVAGSKAVKLALNSIVEATRVEDSNLKAEDLYNIHANIYLQRAIKYAKSHYVSDNYIKRTIDLAKQGREEEIIEFTTDWDDEAYKTVSGQNSNNSVRLSNDFVRSLDNDSDWSLISRTSGKPIKTIKARKLMNDICYAAWGCADPGVQFSTTINQWHTCKEDGDINASNPCSEYLFLDNTACNLASINIKKFQNPDGTINVEDMKHAIRLLTLSLEISIAMAQFPSKEIAELSYTFRTIGLGYANIGAYLMSIGIPYDSNQGRSIVAAITSLMTATSYYVSAEIAGELGAFKGYNRNKKHMLRVIENHANAAKGGIDENYIELDVKPVALSQEHASLDPSLFSNATYMWTKALEEGKKNGYRNAQTTVIAPTGTIGLIMDCDTTGIEPDFSIVKYKKLAGGGYFKLVNKSVTTALEKLNYSKSNIVDITNHIIGHRSLVNCNSINRYTLQKNGFSNKSIDYIESAMKDAFDIRFVFNKFSLGKAILAEVGIDINSSDANNVLHTLGYSEEQIQSAHQYVCGHMCIENAPHILEEHLSIFDCASQNGSGSRSLSYQAHIKMVASAQSFISGAISKTINMPNDASVEDCMDAYMLSWELGVKANAIYRDGSKLSQPLSLSLSGENYDDESVNNILFGEEEVIGENNPDLSDDYHNIENHDASVDYLRKNNNRNRPQNKRYGYIQKVKIKNNTVYLRTGEYNDSSLAEIFIDVYKEGTSFRSLMNSFAVAVSIGLQYGVPLEKFVDAFTFVKFEPSGMVSGHDNIKMATSIIDFIFRDIAIHYLDREDLAHVKTPESQKAQKAEMRLERKAFAEAGGAGPTQYNVQASTTTTSNVDNRYSDSTSASQDTSNANNAFSASNVSSASLKVQSNGSNINLSVEPSSSGLGTKFSGETCSYCSASTLVRNGSCLVCVNCGTTTGCS